MRQPQVALPGGFSGFSDEAFSPFALLSGAMPRRCVITEDDRFS